MAAHPETPIVPDQPQPAKPSLRNSAIATGAAALGFAALAAPAASAAPQTFTVTNANDSGTGSLRQAVIDSDANGNPTEQDVIAFDPTFFATDRTITLTSGQLSIHESLDIEGPTASTLTVSGNNSSRVFYTYNGSQVLDVKISHLVIAHGNSSAVAGGGGVVSWGENLTLDHVTVQSSTAGVSAGGGVAQEWKGDLHIVDSTISGNTGGKGGGVYLYRGDFQLTDSQVTNNQSFYTDENGASGGGVFLYLPNEASITRTTISGNSTDGSGGGLFVHANGVAIDSSTISGNTAQKNGGGAAFYDTADPGVYIVDSTVTGNSASHVGGLYFYTTASGSELLFTTVDGNTASPPLRASGHARTESAHAVRQRPARPDGIVGPSETGGVYVLHVTDGSVNASRTKSNAVNGFGVIDSVLANNSGWDLASGGGDVYVSYSLVENPENDASIHTDGTDKLHLDPMLGPLQNNGGPTLTKAPLPGSPVVDAGDPSYAGQPPYDQRGAGFPRKVGAAVDMGAVEGTAVPIAGVPTLGTFGKLLLALTTMITGFLAIDRKRFLGCLFAATMVAAIATSASAQMRRHPAGKGQGQLLRTAGTVAEITRSAGVVTLRLEDGEVFAAPSRVVQVVDLRPGQRQGPVAATALHRGAAVTVARAVRGDGSVRMMRIRFVGDAPAAVAATR